MNYRLVKIFSLSFALMISFIGFAQKGPADRQRPERFDLDRLAQEIDLTAEQRSEMEAMREAQKAKFEALRAATPAGERPDREKMRALMQESREQIMSILTEEQKASLSAKRAEHEQKRASRSEMGQELKAYRAQHVIPEIARMRKEFDKELSAQEQAKIAGLRTKIKAELGPQGMAHFSKDGGDHHKPGVGDNRHQPQRRSRGEASPKPNSSGGDMHAFVEKNKADFEAVREIAKQHEPEIRAVRNELDSKKVVWKKETDAIRAKYLGDSASGDHLRGRPARGDQGHGDGHSSEHRPGREGEGRRGGISREERGAVMFLLMDPNEVIAEGFDDIEEEGIRVYPNPAGKSTNVAFTNRKAGLVKVELVDSNGRVLETFFSGNKPEGDFDLRVELPQGAGKANVIRVTDGIGARTILVARN